MKFKSQEAYDRFIEAVRQVMAERVSDGGIDLPHDGFMINEKTASRRLHDILKAWK